MGDHLGGGHADYFVVPHVGSLELQNDSADDELDDVWEFGIDDGDQGCVDVGKVGRRHLRFDDGPSEKPLPSDDVLVEELNHYILDVHDVHLVDDTVDTFPEQLPHQFLVLDAGLALHHYLLLELAKFMWRNVDP